MAVITFSGAQLLKVDRDSKRGRLFFSSELTKSVAKSMGWTDLPDKCTGSKMEGAINAATLIFAAKQRELFKGNGEFRCECQTVAHFEIVRRELETARGKGFRYEIRFNAVFASEDGAALAESWLVTVGEGKGSLRVSGAMAEPGEVEENQDGNEGE